MLPGGGGDLMTLERERVCSTEAAWEPGDLPGGAEEDVTRDAVGEVHGRNLVRRGLVASWSPRTIGNHAGLGVGADS